ncbi:MAG: NAD(P)H-dependent oxidoreductase [Proteobacteria bacterium]|nr:MAG: NAD(P)H-dependent oxidoreductase [Pseudomonadota bacterium]
MKRKNILAVCGSLRARSSNLSLLQAAKTLVAETFEFTFFEGLGDLPHFNPDKDGEDALEPVAEFRNLLKGADGVIICTPEYVHGLPGSLKNAIDWTVSSGEWMEKPVLILNASPVSHFAQDSLVEILTTLMARVVARPVPLPGNRLDDTAMLANGDVSQRLGKALDDFCIEMESK